MADLRRVSFTALMASWAAVIAGCTVTSTQITTTTLRAHMTVSPATALQISRITLSVTDAAGHPLDYKDVNVGLSMNSMMMPPNNVTMREIKPGEYAGAGTFTMAGDWTATATGNLPGYPSTIDRCPVSVKD